MPSPSLYRLEFHPRSSHRQDSCRDRSQEARVVFLSNDSRQHLRLPDRNRVRVPGLKLLEHANSAGLLPYVAERARTAGRALVQILGWVPKQVNVPDVPGGLARGLALSALAC